MAAAARLITLLTDFGLSDVYVGTMKGAIANIDPTLQIIDLSHQVPPQHIAIARFQLMISHPYFPPGTVHIAVVDPGVGSQRRAIAVEFAGGFLVGPDNGLFSGVLSQSPAIAAVELDQPEYWRTATPSSTFHGRDIFAPVGAHLACGVPLTDVGTAIDPQALVTLDLPDWHRTSSGLRGSVQYIDRFGNLVTNIPGDEVNHHAWSLTLGTIQMPGQHTYSDAALGEPVAIVGSHGWVEVAVHGGDAQFQLRAELGSEVEIQF
jgi:S-adenosylmethionine hydrolase